MTSIGPARIESCTDAEARRRLRVWLAESVPIASSHVGHVPGSTVPLVVVQLAVRDRPDLADLIRVHALEPDPEGDVQAQWVFVDPSRGGPGWTFLVIELQKPVRADVKLAFRLATHHSVLEAVAATGLIGLAFGPVRWERPDLMRADILFVQVPKRHIRAALDVYPAAA